MHMDKQIENESLSENLLDGTEKIVVVLGGFEVAVARDREYWWVSKNGRPKSNGERTRLTMR